MLWSYMVTDFRTGALVRDAAPIRCEYFTDAIGVAQGAMSGSVAASLDDAADVLGPWRRVIWPCRDGRPYGAFVVTSLAPFGPRSTSVEFAAQRIDSVLTRREIVSTLVFRQVEQLEIFRDLVRFALSRPVVAVDPVYAAMVTQLPGADVPALRLGSELSGVLRDRLDNDDGYQLARHPKVSDMLTNLTQLEGGFEYRLDYGRDSVTGLPAATVRLGYPQLGSATPVVPLEYPGNIVTWTYAADTSDTATAFTAYGAGQGVEKLIGETAYDFTGLDQGMPLLMGSVSSTASEQATLDAAGRAGLAAHGVNEGWTMEFAKGSLGTYELGDQAALNIAPCTRWPTGKRAVVRIVGHRVEPARPGRAEKIIPSVVEVLSGA